MEVNNLSNIMPSETEDAISGNDHKVYTEANYLKKLLDGKSWKEATNIELAQMLSFEAICLGVMRAAKKPYEVIENFVKENLELVKKIAETHPKFFVDASIVEACMKAVPYDVVFIEYLSERTGVAIPSKMETLPAQPCFDDNQEAYLDGMHKGRDGSIHKYGDSDGNMVLCKNIISHNEGNGDGNAL